MESAPQPIASSNITLTPPSVLDAPAMQPNMDNNWILQQQQQQQHQDNASAINEDGQVNADTYVAEDSSSEQGNEDAAATIEGTQSNINVEGSSSQHGNEENTEIDKITIESEEQALELTCQANQLLIAKQFDRGIELYSKVLSYFVSKYGATANECASHYYDYGEAIVYNIQETQLEDDDVAEEDSEDNPGKARVGWEALEYARQLYSHQVEVLKSKIDKENLAQSTESISTETITADEASCKDAELKLATVACKLGELSMELGNWSTALEDLEAARGIRCRLLPADDTKLAEVYFLQGLVLEQLRELDRAYTQYCLALEVYLQRVDEKSVSVANELKLKIEDIEEERRISKEEESKVRSMLKSAIADLAPSSSNSSGASEHTSSTSSISSSASSSSSADLASYTSLQLQAMSVSQLNAVARAHAIDISGCCEKADVIAILQQKIAQLTAQKLSSVQRQQQGPITALATSVSSNNMAAVSTPFTGTTSTTGVTFPIKSTTLTARKRPLPTSTAKEAELTTSTLSGSVAGGVEGKKLKTATE